MGEKPKITSLVQEVIRRLRNTSREAGQEERDVVLTKFARKLYVSGWVEGKKKEILLSVIKGYQKQLGLDQRGLRKLYRPQEEGRTKRVQQKLNGRAEWFRKEKRGRWGKMGITWFRSSLWERFSDTGGGAKAASSTPEERGCFTEGESGERLCSQPEQTPPRE